MLEFVWQTESEAETIALAKKLGQVLQAGDFVTLSGDLGAGKTVFARGIAAGLQISEPVTSPTFTIIQEYQGKFPLYHFDVYRLGEYWELEDLGYEDYFFGEGVCLVEWPEKVLPFLPADHLQVMIDQFGDRPENCRQVSFTARGRRYEQVVRELKRFAYFRN